MGLAAPKETEMLLSSDEEDRSPYVNRRRSAYEPAEGQGTGMQHGTDILS